MALTKSPTARVPQASATVTAGTPLVGGTWLPIGYGVSGAATITNGGTPPTTACGLYLDFSADGTNLAYTLYIGQSDTVASSVNTIPYGLASFGQQGDWTYYRTRFAGNTGQNCTGQATDSYTSGL